MQKLNKTKTISYFLETALALCYYCLEDITHARQYATISSEYSVGYFSGAWRQQIPSHRNKPPSPELWKKFGGWVLEFHAGILWAACLNDWSKVRELSKYPTDECPIARYSESRQDCYWLLALAGVLRGEEAQQQKYSEAVQKCKSKYHRQLLAMLEAILSEDAVAYERELAAHLAYCCEHVFTQPGIDAKVSKDGTILHHYARHLGLKVSWPQEHADRLILL